MAALAEFLQQLLRTGKVVLSAPPAPEPDDRREALTLLERAYQTHRLEVAGPPLDFRPEVALGAGEFVRATCWYLMQHDEPAEAVERRLALPAPQTPADHLSADLLLRYVPQLHRRARAIAPADALSRILAGVLRAWPLSGVLSDVLEPPVTSVAFDGHAGLLLLYAERLYRNQKSDWLPRGRAFEFVELVFRDHNQERAPFLEPARAAAETEKVSS